MSIRCGSPTRRDLWGQAASPWYSRPEPLFFRRGEMKRKDKFQSVISGPLWQGPRKDSSLGMRAAVLVRTYSVVRCCTTEYLVGTLKKELTAVAGRRKITASLLCCDQPNSTLANSRIPHWLFWSASADGFPG